ncbi:uncharacterized protein LOC124131993 isoform X2 [Haliotis rufescens]|uniref:uncharacterized protein LOC124131993 isoform X2 n=1 Tax=Haliotis rufescens TaxID=6454 RepID=UPI00201F64F2|nr:uncharacterized protein LOC124131993 isoform X2 [Haliotis rufescens]
MTISVPHRKIVKVKCSITDLLKSKSKNVKVRDVASVVGQLVSMKLVLGPLSQLMTRSLSMDILIVSTWHSSLKLSCHSIHQLKFWLGNIDKHSSRALVDKSLTTRLVYSDASDSGFGGYCVEIDSDKSHGQWSAKEARQSSTWRELKAVHLTLLSFIPNLKSNRVMWCTDNTNVVSIVEKGSMKIHLQTLALHIFEICTKQSIQLYMQWIPRCDNQTADYLSRMIDYDDWGISKTIFQQIERKWGPHQTDRFASYYNTKLQCFNSRYSNPGSDVVDCFTVNWGGFMNWVVPPVCLIPRAIKHMSECKAKGTLVIPEWHSACFWPMVCPNSVFIPQVRDWMYLPRSKEAYVASRIKGGMFGERDLSDTFRTTYSDEIATLPRGVRELAGALPGLLAGCRADSTTTKYTYGFGAWKRHFVLRCGRVAVRPHSVMVICLC